MNDQTMNRRALPGLTALHLPPQAAPINRIVSRAALAGILGVEAHNLIDNDDDEDEMDDEVAG
jgi:hypothetical protein